MQTLMALNELPKNYAGGVRFRMMNGLTRVICWVTREALNRAEHEKSSQLNQIPRFERHRIQIEQLASQKYDAGEQAPIVMSFDLVTASPGRLNEIDPEHPGADHAQRSKSSPRGATQDHRRPQRVTMRRTCIEHMSSALS